MKLNNINMRQPNVFEYVLLIIGILAAAVGYLLVHSMMLEYGLRSYEVTVGLLLWFIVIILIILTAVSENSKEELKIVIKQHSDELKFLREDLRRKR